MALVVKNPPADTGDGRDAGSASGPEDPLEESLAPHSSSLCPENLTDRGAWGCIMSQESDTTEMTLNACTHFENVKK